MYTVVLIDDEKYALSDMTHTFPFKAYGFTLIAAYTDAIQAVKKLPALAPDVVFADIRMPEISGLELIRRTRESLPDTLFVLVSGYSEFEYAKKAIQLEVFEYLLKPFDEADAEELLQRLRTRLAQRDSGHAPQAQLTPEQYAHSNVQFSRMLQYVDQHIYERLFLEQLAEKYFINPNYCGQLFKKTTGKTFSKYVRDVRLARAEQLLSASQMSITDVGAAVGYEDLHYFTRLFTDAMGMSPSKYRAQVHKSGKREG